VASNGSVLCVTASRTRPNNGNERLACNLFNNAGIYMAKAFTDYSEEDYNLVMNTNVASFFYMTQQVIPQIKKQKLTSEKITHAIWQL
jgi:NAD(P)-dependent dehydrogenase (short-subunit alcohol dehydrogenase family)